ELVRRLRVRREETSKRRGDQALGIQPRTPLPFRHPRSCGGCGNEKRSAPRVGRAWTLGRHVRGGLREGQSLAAITADSYFFMGLPRVMETLTSWHPS